MLTSKRPIERTKTAILAIILVSYVMIILDTSVVLTGLPRIHRDLGLSDAELAWVQSAYTLMFGGFLLLGARAGDMLGRRRMLIVGLGLFTLASLAIGAAQTPFWIIGARAAQGLGAAILAPSTLALLQTTFTEGAERTRAVSYYSAVAGIAASVGLVLGGVLADWISWRVGFLINLPIGVAMILATRRYVEETERRAGSLDFIGAITSTLGMSALVHGFIRSSDAGWSDPLTLGSLAGAAILLPVFLVTEWRAKRPIMPLRLFAHRVRVSAYAARFLFLGAMIGFFFFTTLYLQGVANFGAAATGIAFLPMTLVNFAVAMVAAPLTRWLGRANLLAIGLVFCLVGIGWLSRVGIDTPYLIGVALPMALLGIGQGMALSPLTALGIVDVADDDAGAASGIVNVAHQMGNALGLAVLVSLAELGVGGLSGQALLAHRVSMALSGSASMMALAFLLVLGLIVLPAARAPGREGRRITAPRRS